MTQIQIPSSIEEAVKRLDGIGKLLTAKEWERAAIVWAFTASNGQGSRTDITSSDRKKLSDRAFADLGIHGLSGISTVLRYRRHWQEAIDAKEVVEVAPGDTVDLPTREYPTYSESSPRVQFHGFEGEDTASQVKAIVSAIAREPEVAKRIEDVFVQRAGQDPVLARRVYRAYAEHHVTPEVTLEPRSLIAEMGFGGSIYAQIRGWSKDLGQYLVSIEAHRDNPEIGSIVQEEIDYIEKGKGLLDQYADKFRGSIGINADAVFNRLMGERR